jgi:hypothetical protein
VTGLRPFGDVENPDVRNFANRKGHAWSENLDEAREDFSTRIG